MLATSAASTSATRLRRRPANGHRLLEDEVPPHAPWACRRLAPEPLGGPAGDDVDGRDHCRRRRTAWRRRASASAASPWPAAVDNADNIVLVACRQRREAWTSRGRRPPTRSPTCSRARHLRSIEPVSLVTRSTNSTPQRLGRRPPATRRSRSATCCSSRAAPRQLAPGALVLAAAVEGRRRRKGWGDQRIVVHLDPATTPTQSYAADSTRSGITSCA